MKKYIYIMLFQITTLTTNGQQFGNCKYPTFVSADSLVNTVVQECIKRIGATYVPDSIWKRYHYDNSNGINLDSAYSECQKHLIQKLGREIYCKYITMELMSFQKSDNRLGPYKLSFILELPNLKNEHGGGYSHFHHETIIIIYVINFQDDTSFIINYPTNLPYCNGTIDCGFVISKEKAISIAKKIRFLNDSDEYYTDVDGANWIITIAENIHGQSKSIKIDLRTGRQSEVTTMQRID